MELTSDDFVSAGFSESVAPAGTYTWIFSGDTARTEVEQSSGEKIVCNATMSPLATGFQLTYGVGKCGGEIDEISWTLEDDGLHLTLITTNAPVDQNKAYLETKLWQPVDNP